MKLIDAIRIHQVLSRVNIKSLSGKPLYSIARNINHITPLLEAYGKKRDSLIKEISGGQNEILGTEKEKINAFTEAIRKEEDTQVEVDLFKIKIPDSELTGMFDNASDISALIQHNVLEVIETNA